MEEQDVGLSELQLDTDIKSSVASTSISVSTQCKVCELDFTPSTIFKHVSHSNQCKASYSFDEIQAFKHWRKQRRELGRKRKYDSSKRRGSIYSQV